jgi:hypothetical protein
VQHRARGGRTACEPRPRPRRRRGRRARAAACRSPAAAAAARRAAPRWGAPGRRSSAREGEGATGRDG